MAEIITAAKSLRNQAGHDSPEPVLTAVKSTTTKAAGHRAIIETNGASDPNNNSHDTEAKSPEDALHILQSQPSLRQLLAVIRQLDQRIFPSGSCSLHIPGPLQAQIINSLLVNIVPDFWTVLSDRECAALTRSLRTVPGLNAVIARIRLQSQQRDNQSGKSTQSIHKLMELSERLFAGDDVLSSIFAGLTANSTHSIKRDMAWKELVTLVASGKISSTIAQAEDIIDRKPQCWLAKGNVYAAWLGRNIAALATAHADLDNTAAAGQVLVRAMNLAHPNTLLAGLSESILQATDGRHGSPEILQSLLHGLPVHVKRRFTETSLRWLSGLTQRPSQLGDTDGTVAAVAAYLSLLRRDVQITQHLIAFLTDPKLSSSVSLATRRAAVVVLSSGDETDNLYVMIEILIQIFSDRLFIDHASNAQQDSLVQSVLLLSGYLHRQKPVAFLVLGRSSNAIHGVSNRLDSSNSRARWLGMIFGTAVSRLVDKEGSRMNFGTDELDTDEAAWYLKLVNVQDTVGSINDFSDLLKPSPTPNSKNNIALPLRQVVKKSNAEKKNTLNGKPIFGPPRPPAQTTIIGERVTEIFDDETNEDDLKPYSKPDSDPEDSDEDATLVNRHKIRAPVYIRDLMSMLRDDQNHDRFQIGIKNAAPLIRRKANFGAEVKDHAEELSNILCNLQDPFETESFEELKISALVALLLADVTVIAPRLCQQAFSSDYSLAQRCIILSAIGLGGRELAGFVNEDTLNPIPPHTSFPTKKLSPRLHSIYTSIAPATKRLNAASADMEREMIQPLALRAADQSTAHLDAVKVRKFSSRMDVERTKRKPAPNQLAKVFAESFFLRLVNRYQQEIAAYGPASVYASAPFVLVTYLKTLALLLHASGPSTLGLAQITAEFWDLLLSLRGQAISDMSILQAVLFSLLTLLEVNTDQKRQIATDLPKQLMETQQWVDLVFERTGGGNLIGEQKQDDEAKIRTLAASVLVKIKEIIDAYQQQLVGYMP